MLASFQVAQPGAAWIRIKFGECVFAGSRAEGGSYLRLTGELDGGVQILDADAFAQWAGTSAYFNGDAVAVELVSGQVGGTARLSIIGATYEPHGNIAARSICGPLDDRVATSEAANARLLPAGCTAWIFTDTNHTFLTAGHCSVGLGTAIEFNVPLSNSDGTLVHPSPEHQYAADAASAQASSLAVGDDWCYFGVYPNSNTGLTPYQAQGVAYDLDVAAPPVDGQRVRITGFGTVSPPVSRTFSQTQRAGYGSYLEANDTTLRYDADTTGGNSGAPIYMLDTRTVVGIHTNAGCDATGGSNAGTAAQSPGLQTALASPRGVCGSGTGAVWGSLFVVGDLANNLGAISSESASFGQLSQVNPGMQGLAYDWGNDRLLGIDINRRLYSMNPDSGIATLMGTLASTGTPITEPINGLGFDPWTGILYGVAQASGQLYRIDAVTMLATRVGAPGGGSIGGVDFDADHRALVGIDSSGSSPRLVRIDTATGARTVVGALGVGAGPFGGLAYNSDDGGLYTIASSTGNLYRVSPLTGVAELVGATGGAFGSGFGLAARSTPPLCARLDYNRDGNVDQGDIDALVQAISSGEWTVSPDLNRDGSIDSGDVSALLDAVAGNCH
ncbi:MAG: dockerin type I domain-containing protein [Phycisphaerales bacterium]